MRRRDNQLAHGLVTAMEDVMEEALFTHYKEVSDPWSMNKDGKFQHWELLTSRKYLTGKDIKSWILIDRCLRK